MSDICSPSENYDSLCEVYLKAVHQAERGKGAERHASDEPWTQQQIFEIARRIGNVGPAAGPLFQAVKKIYELHRLPTKEAREREALGALNYLAAAFDMIGEGMP